MQLIRRGDRGAAVAEVRAALAVLDLLPPDPASAPLDEAVFDDSCDGAVRGFQQDRGLSVDGIVGPETYRALDEARHRLGDRVLLHSLTHPYVGDDVVALQERLLELGYDAGRAEGVFGPQTAAALTVFQREMGLVPDGTFGPATMRAFRRLGRKVVGGRPHQLREAEVIHRRGPTLVGKAVVVDPGHGGGDRGVVVGGLDEAALVADLAARLEGRLTAAGMTAYLSHGPGLARTDAERAAFANATGADLLLSLHVDGSPDERAEGVATYHFGTGSGASSTIGERLASLVQREVVARTGLLDCRVHPKTWEILRRSRMPAIRLELGYLTNPRDRALLADPQFRDTVAEGVLVAVQRLYLPADLDPPTGQLRLPAALAG
jgi:N-acetylmuramoyl-L-alanine amidase